MAAPISGAPTLTTTDSADEPGMKRTRLNEAFDALSQVRLRARSRRCSPGWPMLTLSYAALVVCLAQALACPPAHGDASAPKAPSGAGAPLLNASASAEYYRFPLTRLNTSASDPPRGKRCRGAGASRRHHGTTKPKPLDRPCVLEFKLQTSPRAQDCYAKSRAPNRSM